MVINHDPPSSQPTIGVQNQEAMMPDSLDTIMFFAPQTTLALFVLGLAFGWIGCYIYTHFKLVKRDLP